ncbi:tRNA1(Val) (adenine(37)-N6)-methyltransferase [Ligilactobacillus equi]
MTKSVLYAGERIDALYANDIKIIQSPQVFSFSLDAVLLAHFAQPIRKAKGLVVDLCAGNGAVALFMAYKTQAHIMAVEIQERLADMAQRSVQLNNLQDQIEVRNADLKDAFNYLTKDTVDTITCNPPYFPLEVESKRNPNEHLALARHEIAVNFAEICQISSGLLKMGGKLYLVHRPDRLPELITTLVENRLAPKRIQFIHPKPGQEANMVLIEAIKDGKPNGVRVLPAIVAADEAGNYTGLVKELLYGKE